MSTGRLSAFVTEHRAEIIVRCRARVAARMAPRPTELELVQGIPLFLDQLARTLLRVELPTGSGVGPTATKHGSDLLGGGFTIAQVVHDYGDVCQSIIELAIERAEAIDNEDFQALNLCLDEAIADAVTEYTTQREINVVAAGAERATEDLGYLAHELRNLLGSATLAVEALSSGRVGISGSTGGVLRRSLSGMSHLVTRSLAVVRLKAGVSANEHVVVGDLIEEVEVSAMMEAKVRGHQLTVEVHDPAAIVHADRQILASILANLIQNAYKYTHGGSNVVLRVSTTADRVRFEIEDECGGLEPGVADSMFEPFAQQGADRSGLGLGLAICLRGVEAIGGVLRVHDLPGKGCVFVVDLPRTVTTSAL